MGREGGGCTISATLDAINIQCWTRCINCLGEGRYIGRQVLVLRLKKSIYLIVWRIMLGR